jgi:prolyl-tRNA editing enzyme YbaK/EbsC (Cys-tRNA(Pro) deacylase)
VLVITSGDRRVDEKKVEAIVARAASWAAPTRSS